MKLASGEVGKVEVIKVLLKSLDADTATKFRRAMETRLPKGTQIVFDLTPVEFVDSSGLGAMLSCLRHLNATGGDLKLCNMSKAVRAMFELVRMHRVIEIYDTHAEAITAFKHPSGD